jgi:hypothetical protein
MRSFGRVLVSLPLLAVGIPLGSDPAASQRHSGDTRAAPLLHGVARMSCGTPRPHGYALSATGMRGGGSGGGSLAARSWMLVRSAELVGTLQLSFGAEPRRGTADAERPLGGRWEVPQLGYCTGGRGPLQFALITPAAEGRRARFEVRGPASHIQRPGARALAEGGEVRFVGTCGRRQEVIMEIWPAATLDAGQGPAEPERYRLVGTVNCGGATGAAGDDSSATATPSAPAPGSPVE